MKKVKILVGLLMLAFSSFGQIKYYDSTALFQDVNSYLSWKSGIIKGVMILKGGLPQVARKDSGAISYKNGNIFVWDGTTWKLSSGQLEKDSFGLTWPLQPYDSLGKQRIKISYSWQDSALAKGIVLGDSGQYTTRFRFDTANVNRLIALNYLYLTKKDKNDTFNAVGYVRNWQLDGLQLQDVNNAVVFTKGATLKQSPNFIYDSTQSNLSIGNNLGSGTQSSIALNSSRAVIAGNFNGAVYGVGSGVAAGVYDISKSHTFQNRGNTYLKLSSESNTEHTADFSNLKIKNVPPITTNVDSVAVWELGVLKKAALVTNDLSKWSINGNSGTDSAVNYLGTSDNQPLILKVNGSQVGRFGIQNNVALAGGIANGDFSIASGLGSASNGSFSTALGYYSQANEFASTSMGNSIASGVFSTSMGSGTVASGQVSTSIGIGSIASGYTSTAMGIDSKSKSYGETSIGIYNDTINPISDIFFNPLDKLFTIGNGSNPSNRSNALTMLKNGKTGFGILSPQYTVDVEGDVNVTGQYRVNGQPIIGWGLNGNSGTDSALNYLGTSDAMPLVLKVNNAEIGKLGLINNVALAGGVANSDFSLAIGESSIANGYSSISLGNSNIADGIVSTAMGYVTVASGSYSTSMGFNTTASGYNSTAMGYGTVASGSHSLATGNGTVASGNNSTAMGNNTLSSGQNSVASGQYTAASGIYSTAMGIYSISKDTASLVIGKYNDTTITNNLFIVGNGFSDPTRSNALNVNKNGKTGFGILSPQYTVDVNGDVNVTGNFKVNGTNIGGANGTVTQFNFTNTTGITGTVTNATTTPTLSLSLDVPTILGYTPYNATNPNNYITSSSLSPYLLSSAAATTYYPLTGGSYLSATNGTGFLGLTAQSTAPTAPTSGLVKLYADATGKLSWLSSLGFSRTLNSRPLTANRVYTFYDRDYTVADSADVSLKANIASPTFTGTVSGITQTMVGLGNVNNTSDINKPVSTAQQTALNLKLNSADTASLSNRINTRIDGNYYNYYRFFTDFISGFGTVTNSSELFATSSGTGAGFTMNSEAGRPGIYNANTGTTATGRHALTTPNTSTTLGGGVWTYETMVQVPTLSTSVERYQLLAGFIDNNSAANQTDGIYFLYDEGGASTGSAVSANWQIVTSSNSTRTFTTTSTAVVANTWYKLKIVVNAGASSVEYFINDVSAGTITTNIPNGTSRQLGWGFLQNKSIGTTSRTVNFDAMLVEGRLTTSR